MELSWNVVCFSGVDWTYNRQRPQWVMSALADRGASVLYVDNLGVRMPRPSDARRVARRLARWLRTSVRPRTEVYPRLRRDAPIIPAPVRGMARRSLVRRLRRRLSDTRPLIVWTYLPTPVVADVAADLRADLLVFDWADDASEHVLFATASHRRRIAEWEETMLRRADLVFVASKELLRRRGSPNPRTFLVPHGAPRAGEAAEPPPEIGRLPRPRIGYVGTVSDWVDLALLADMADARPEWSFVLVGPVRAPVERLRSRRNVRFLGARPHDQVAGILSAFDVGLVPYRVTPATQAASPVKVHEYLAQGLPVVSSDLPEIRALGPDVRIASGLKGFLSEIEAALGTARPAPRPGTPWEARVGEMLGHMRAALAERPDSQP